MPRHGHILIAALVVAMTSCSLLYRDPVAFESPEARSTDGLTWSMSVPSCNGDPVISQLVQSDEEVGVEVTATMGPIFIGRDPECDDSVAFTLDDPLGHRVLRDLVSGNEFIVCGMVAPGQQAGDDAPCR